MGFVKSVLSGFGQIVLSDNPITGVFIILAIALGSPSQMFLSVWCACIATAFAFFIGIDKVLMRLGLYTFSAAIVGLGISLWGYSNQGITIEMLLVGGVAAIISVLLTAAFNGMLSKWEAPSLSVPYCTTLIMVIPALFLMGKMNAAPLLPVETVKLTQGFSQMDVSTFLESTLYGVGEICFQVGILPSCCLVIAILISSRVDGLVALIGAFIGTGFAVMLGLPYDNIVIGLYGYNAALVGMGLFGRAFRMSLPCAVFTILMMLFSVILTAGLGVLFMPLGAPVAALPFGIIVIAAIVGRDYLKKLTPVSILLWGVPETIEKALKAQEQTTENTQSIEV